MIIGERLVALAMAQIAENKDALQVFVEFLTPGGPEIYLKPAQDYITPDRPVTFYTVLEAARRKGQTAIGYRLLLGGRRTGACVRSTLEPGQIGARYARRR